MKKTNRVPPELLLTKLILYSLFLALSVATAGCTWLGESKATLAKRRVVQQVRASMVSVRVHFKRDIDNEFYSDDKSSYQERFARQMVERKMSLDLGGVVLDDRGRILVADPEIEPRLIDRIEVIDADGRARPGRLLTVLKKMDAAILELDDPAGLQPIHFAPSDDFDELTADSRMKDSKIGSLPPLYLVSISRSGRDWYIGTGSASESYRFNSEDPLPQYLLGQISGDLSDQLSSSKTTGSTPYLVVDGDGNFLGAVMRGIVDLDQEYRIWKGRDILAAINSDLRVNEFRRTQETLRDRYSQLYHRVKIYYRQPSDQAYGSTPQPEQILYGLALNSTDLLVPLEMSRRRAKQIESIEVQLDTEEERPNSPATAGGAGSAGRTSQAEFLGAYRDFAVFLIRIKDARFTEWLDLESTGQVGKVVPFWTVYARRRFGRKDLRVWYARCLRESKGYGDAVHLRPSTPLLAGSVLLDLDGRLAGFYLRERPPAEEQIIMEKLGSEYYGYKPQSLSRLGLGQTRIFPISEIAAALNNPTDVLDPNIRAMTKTQAKRRMWLGVEDVPLNPELAKRVGLEPLTKDGTIGFIVSSVYADSPAERIGIKPGDVLLRIKDQARDYPTELRTELASQPRGGYSPWQYSGSGGPNGAKVWKSRQNFLTEFLAAIGQDRTIEVTFCSRQGPAGWKLFTKNIKVQQAPLDYDSAERFRDRRIGLTVRDLTYEVRHALKMLPDDPGVVVSKVEEGTPAAVARIGEGELITRINSTEVVSVEDFEKKISTAHQNNADTVKVEIVRLGKTRVADLSLSD